MPHPFDFFLSKGWEHNRQASAKTALHAGCLTFGTASSSLSGISKVFYGFSSFRVFRPSFRWLGNTGKAQSNPNSPAIAIGTVNYSFPVHYRPYTPSDFDALYAIEETCSSPPSASRAATCVNCSRPRNRRLDRRRKCPHGRLRHRGMGRRQNRPHRLYPDLEVLPPSAAKASALNYFAAWNPLPAPPALTPSGFTWTQKTPPLSASTRGTAITPRAGKRTTTPQGRAALIYSKAPPDRP